jgi:hypothetical protein
MRNQMRTRLLRRLALGLAVVAVAAPGAQARIEKAGVAQPERAGAVRPDDRATRFTPAAKVDPLVLRHDNPADFPRGLEPLVGSEGYGIAPVQIVSASDSFDWSDAGIGAGSLFGLVLLASGAALAVRRSNRTATA